MDILERAKFFQDQGQHVIIPHGCNCFHTMGAGIAFYFKRKFPIVFEVDKKTLYGDEEKLGTFSVAKVQDDLTILNCYTQYRYGRDQVYVDEEAVYNAICKICKDFPEGVIVLPRIGCGEAGGDWERISIIINKALNGREAHVCYL